MKKSGFTLAEVLVTLGIIGVVAALTTPALIQNIGNAKVGPKLQKAVATFETAAEMMLNQENVNSIVGVVGTGNNSGQDLGKKLQNYMKISLNTSNPKTYYPYSGTGTFSPKPTNAYRFDSDDGMTYYIPKLTKEAVKTSDGYEDIANNQYLGKVYIDIDGGQQGVNKLAKDTFAFALYNDGTLRPWGISGYMRSGKPGTAVKLWSTNENCNDAGVTDADTCTGSIFANGMKIIYE